MQNENIKLENLKNQKVAVLGLGEENLALVKYLVQNDIEVVVCDQKVSGELQDYDTKIKNLPVQFRLGSHYLDCLTDFDIIFRTPGLPYFNPKIQEAKKVGVEISSQTKLFFELCPCPIIGVTGTKGKGTTATLIGEILKKASGRSSLSATHSSPVSISPSANRDAGISLGSSARPKIMRKVFLGGNIGRPPIGFLDQLTADDIVVLELSSFQLQDLRQSPHIAVILDIKVDHLDYHKDEQEYIKAKRNIVKFQTKNDLAVINADYFTSVEFAVLTPAKIYWFSRRKSVDEGVWVKNQKEFVLRINDQETTICQTNEVTLRGEHNFENICAASIASYLTGVDLDSIKNVIKSFKGLEHRLEFVRTLNNISFYNDSFSTTPDTTIAAIKSFSEPIILLLGGSEKNADYKELAEAISLSSVKTIINIGQTGRKIINLIKRPSINRITEVQNINKAVEMAFKLSTHGGIVLLSPASASFDRFQNYKERGKKFKKKVLEL